METSTQRELTCSRTSQFESGFVITDFWNGTLTFWDKQRGAYAEIASISIYKGALRSRSVDQQMFDDQQLINSEKGTFRVRAEIEGDLLSYIPTAVS